MSKGRGRRWYTLRGGTGLVALVVLAVVAVTRGRTVFGFSPVLQGVIGLFVLTGLFLAMQSLLERYTTHTSRFMIARPRKTLVTGAVVTTAMWAPYGALVWLVTSLGPSAVLPLVLLSVLGAPLFAVTLVGTGVGVAGIGRWATDWQGGGLIVVGLLGVPIGAFPVPFALFGLLITVVGIGAMFWDMRHTRAPLDSQDRESYARQHRYL